MKLTSNIPILSTVLLSFVILSCQKGISDYVGESIVCPKNKYQVRDFIQRSNSKDRQYYLVQLLLEDMDGNVLDSVNARISGYLPYTIEWMDDGELLAIKGMYQMTRLFKREEDKFKSLREWNDKLRKIDDIMWDRLSE